MTDNLRSYSNARPLMGGGRAQVEQSTFTRGSPRIENCGPLCIVQPRRVLVPGPSREPQPRGPLDMPRPRD